MSARPAVVFDLDGTLVDSLPSIAKAANSLLLEHGEQPLPDRTIAGFVGLGEQVFLDKLIAAGGLDPQNRAALMARFLTLYKATSSDVVLFDGVPEALEALKHLGVPLGLCTNKPGGPTEVVLRATGLDGMLDAVVAGDSLPLRKPDPAPLVHVFDQLGGRGIYVGDSPVDAQTARAAAVPFALFTEGIRTVDLASIPHDAAFGSFAEMMTVYRRLAP